MVEPTDEELMLRFCAGDTSAFEALYTRRAAGLHAYLRHLVRDEAQAEDLLQATFLSVVRAKDRWRRGSKVSTWMFSIATNAARDVLRRDRRWAEGSEPRQRLTSEDDRRPAEGLSFEPALRDPKLAARLETALAQLPLAQREAVVLHHVLEWSFEEMAEVLGTSPGNLRVRCHRAFATLREALGEERS
ncbi:MAG: sigma-70 family RNA polymerase sigma factor [Deltaproteobacteria bacterium]|nr:sigma-70 family RNA polymerase sigma factor [Deltaproteobacteria bacterium]